MFFARSAPVFSAITLAAMLALAGCGHSDKASDAATPDNVEMPAEEAMSGVDAGAVPVADPAATATEAASVAATPTDSGATPAQAPAPVTPGAPASGVKPAKAQ